MLRSPTSTIGFCALRLPRNQRVSSSRKRSLCANFGFSSGSGMSPPAGHIDIVQLDPARQLGDGVAAILALAPMLDARVLERHARQDGDAVIALHAVEMLMPVAQRLDLGSWGSARPASSSPGGRRRRAGTRRRGGGTLSMRSRTELMFQVRILSAMAASGMCRDRALLEHEEPIADNTERPASAAEEPEFRGKAVRARPRAPRAPARPGGTPAPPRPRRRAPAPRRRRWRAPAPSRQRRSKPPPPA